MDSKYSIGTPNGGRNGNHSTPAHKFNLKRKWNSSPQTPNGHNGNGTQQNAFKKQCQQQQNGGAHNGHHHKQNGGGPTTTPNRPQPAMSLMDQRRSLPVFQVRQK